MDNEATLFAATAATLNLLQIVPNFILAHHEKNAEFRKLIHFLTGTGTANRNIAEPTSIERSEAKRTLKLEAPEQQAEIALRQLRSNEAR